MSVMTTVLDGAARPVARRPKRAPKPSATPAKAVRPAPPVLVPSAAAPELVPATAAELIPAVAIVEAPARWQTVAALPAERALGVLAHLSGALTSVAGPFLVARFAGRNSEYVREQAIAAANFQLAFLAVLAPFALVGLFAVGLAELFVVPLALAWLLTTVLASVAAATGERYRYPVGGPLKTTLAAHREGS